MAVALSPRSDDQEHLPSTRSYDTLRAIIQERKRHQHEAARSRIRRVRGRTTFRRPLDNAWLRGTTDKTPIDYKAGEPMTITITPMDVGELAAGEWLLDWKRTGDDGIREAK